MFGGSIHLGRASHRPIRSAIVIRMRLTRGAQLNEGKSRAACCPFCPMATRLRLLQCCISRLAVVKPWGRCGLAALRPWGGDENEISGTGLQGQVRYGGAAQAEYRKHAHPRPRPHPHRLIAVQYTRCNVSDRQNDTARPHGRLLLWWSVREMAGPDSSLIVPPRQECLVDSLTVDRRVIAARGT